MSVCLYKSSFLKKSLSLLVLITFGLTSGIAPSFAQLPPVGQMFSLTSGYEPPILRGMTVHAENPLLFDFIVDRGQDMMADGPLKAESEKLIKYFLASMTIPDKDAWVNLSPFEKNRIIPEALGQTEMGKTMLEQDYMLKQLAASLTNPDTELGKKYWAKVGNGRDRSLQDLSKVWIVPAGATVVEKDGFAYITESKLDVKMEEDYQNMSSPQSLSGDPLLKMDSRFRGNDKESGEDTFNNQAPGTNHQGPATEVFRSLILPKLIKEVNEGKTFAPTRQVYQSVILASWYKKALKDSLLGKIYADKSKIEGITTDEKDIKQKVYDQYLEAFKKGVYNVIKEEEEGEETIPRKYFSGGLRFDTTSPGQLTFVTSSSSVNWAINRIKEAGIQFAIIAVRAMEGKERGAEKLVRLSALIWGSNSVPKKYQADFRSTLQDNFGVKIDYYNDGHPRIDRVISSVKRRAKFKELMSDLNKLDETSVINKIADAFFQKIGPKAEDLNKKAVKKTIQLFVEKLKGFNEPKIFHTDSGLTIKFYRVPYNIGDFRYITPIIERLKAKRIESDTSLTSIQEISVEFEPGGKNYTDIYRVTFGNEEYIIKHDDSLDTSQIRRQAFLLQRLNAKGENTQIAKLVLDGSEEQYNYIVMNYLPEQSLRDKIEEDGFFSLKGHVKVAVSLAEATKFVHDAQVIIRDLKSPNVQIGPAGEVSLHDFDFSSLKVSDGDIIHQSAGDIKGKYDYDSAGVRQQARIWDEQRDIADIGAILLGMAGIVLPEHIDQLDTSKIKNEEFVRIIKRTIAPRSVTGDKARYQTTDELLRDLIALQESLKSVPDSPPASSAVKDLIGRFNSLLDSFLLALKISVEPSPDYYRERWPDGLFVDEIDTPLGKMQIIQRYPRSTKHFNQYSIFHQGREIERDQEEGIEGFNFSLEENALRVSTLFLRPEYQDKGVGASIVKWLARYALKNKKEWLKNTYTHNPRIIYIFSKVMIPETIVIKELDSSGRGTGKQYTYDEFLAKFGNKDDSGLSGSWHCPLRIEGKPNPDLVKKGSSSVGGIDFDPSKLNLQIKRDGKGVPLPLPQQDVEHIDIKGLFPVILNIGPVNVKTLPLLGKLESQSEMALSDS